MSTTNAEDLPKQYHHAEPERTWYDFWRGKNPDDRDYFHSEPDPERKKFPKGPFTIVIPPPNVTGALHLGHALNNSLQDILIRFKRMQGYNALWMPGTDHAGIATQAVVERRLLQDEKKSRHDLGREGLVARIWDWKKEYEQRILGQLQRLGASCDWQRTRFTFDDVCARAVRQTFFSLFKEGKIYRGKRLVNWDTYLQTAVSDDEVENVTVDGSFWHIRYPVINPQPGEPTHVTIATTRPETMLGDTAVAVHPNPAAALDAVEKELRAKFAEASDKEKPTVQKELDALAERRTTHLPQLEKLRDMALAGRMLQLPLTDRQIPLVADEWAKPEMGSGCVKITPAHDPNDYDVGKRQKLPMINILNPDGTLNDAVPERFRGKKMSTEARKLVVEELAAAGLHDPEKDCEARKIELPMSDRSKTPIEPYLADQWFVRMGDVDDKPGLAQSAMDAVSDERVKIFPERYRRTYLDWLSEKRDWPVSRQLWWGHRIPVWTMTIDLDTSTQAVDIEGPLTGEFSNSDYEKLRTVGIEVYGGAQIHASKQIKNFVSLDWITDENAGDTLLQVSIEPGHEDFEQKLEAIGFRQDPDVLDTWFSSALWPHSTLGWPGPAEKAGDPEWSQLGPYYYPTNTLITSRDIITLWVARMVLTGLHNVGDVPFREVFIHPKILDAFGDTMSKSKGNGVDPLDVIDKFGADALRFGLAYLTTETQDVRMPVDFECPHCGELIEQTKKNRIQPRVDCKKCGKAFRTQWAEKPEDTALPRGAVVSERFELARNFCNKLWNASRFAMLNLEGYTAAPVADADLTVEDRWVLSRLNTVTAAVTADLDRYHYADAMRSLYEFAWDEFCSFYVEMVKSRLQDAAQRPTAQRVLTHVLDVLMRLLHPTMPFITEEIWQRLKDFAPERGLERPQPAAASVMIADWPVADTKRQDPTIEARFARFQEMLRGLRDLRAKQNITPKTAIRFSLKCDAETASLLKPMAPYFGSLAGAEAADWGPSVKPFETEAALTLPFGELHVDLEGLIDVAAEISRKEKERDNLAGVIKSKEGKLGNASFVERAPADVVAKERQALDDAKRQLESVEQSLAALKAKKS
ncbi:MAG: valine--tRNA ligase [Planctomycetaceae bacterium]|nr:valine--tRNA ligase [Planctomycetaceae bacterium]